MVYKTWTMGHRIAFIMVFLSLVGLVAVGCSKKQVKTTPTDLEKFTLEEPLEPLEELEIAKIEEFPPEEPIDIKEVKELPKIKDIYFEFDKSDLTSRARKVLTANAEWLKENSKVKVLVEGHCDERGTIEYNLALGQRRAVMVRKYLITLGIESKRINTISYGEEKPVDIGHDEEAWARNRRAHILAIVED